MVILKEKSSFEGLQESGWGNLERLSMDKALTVTGNAISELDAFIKKYSGSIADAETFDGVARVKDRIALLYANSFIVHRAKVKAPQSGFTKQMASAWVKEEIATLRKGILVRYPRLNYNEVFANAMKIFGF